MNSETKPASHWLVTTQWLQDHLDAPDIVVVDGSDHSYEEITHTFQRRAERYKEPGQKALLLQYSSDADKSDPNSPVIAVVLLA